ncbi:hypothetical protein Hte_005385 [Hypoxylon texense]
MSVEELSAQESFDLNQKTDQNLLASFFSSPVIYDGHDRVMRIPETLVIKGGGQHASQGQAEMQKFAVSVGLPVPTVHRYFSALAPHHHDIENTEEIEIRWYIVMDFIPGPTLEQAWPGLDQNARDEIFKQVAHLVMTIQSVPVDGMPPEGTQTVGVGTVLGLPSTELALLQQQASCKIGSTTSGMLVHVSICSAPSDFKPFLFKKMIFAHLDIAPRNIIIHESSNQIYLIDRAFAGIYPLGFEQAGMYFQVQGDFDIEFGEGVLSTLPSYFEKERKQLEKISYGLTTEAWL